MKTCVLLLWCCFFSAFCLAQKNTYFLFDFGAAASGFQPESLLQEYTFKPYGSIHVRRELTYRTYFITGLAFQPKGMNISFIFEENPGDFSAGQQRLHLSYLSLPALVEFEFDYKDRNRLFYIQAGPFISILLNDEWNIQEASNFKEKTNIDARLDYGFALGTGMGWFIGNRLVFNVRFRAEFGLKKINIDNEFGELENAKTRNYPLTLGFEYSLK